MSDLDVLECKKCYKKSGQIGVFYDICKQSYSVLLAAKITPALQELRDELKAVIDKFEARPF